MLRGDSPRRHATALRSLIPSNLWFQRRAGSTIRCEELRRNRNRTDLQWIYETRKAGWYSFLSNHEVRMPKQPSLMAMGHQNPVGVKCFQLLAICRGIPEVQTIDRARHMLRPLRRRLKNAQSPAVLRDGNLSPVLWWPFFGKPASGRKRNRLD
jgi:hypothetical protein